MYVSACIARPVNSTPAFNSRLFYHRWNIRPRFVRYKDHIHVRRKVRPHTLTAERSSQGQAAPLVCSKIPCLLRSRMGFAPKPICLSRAKRYDMGKEGFRIVLRGIGRKPKSVLSLLRSGEAVGKQRKSEMSFRPLLALTVKGRLTLDGKI